MCYCDRSIFAIYCGSGNCVDPDIKKEHIEEPMKVTEKYDEETKSVQYSFSEKKEPKLEVGNEYKINYKKDERYPVIRKLVYQNNKTWIFEDEEDATYQVPKYMFKKYGYEITEHRDVHVGEKSMPIDMKLTTNSVTDNKEIKPEVGKKYNIPDTLFNPCIFIYFDHEDNDAPYCFLDKHRILQKLSFDDIKGITEHREMIKHTEEGWFSLSSTRSPNNQCILDRALNKFARCLIYKTRQDAIQDSPDDCKEQIYARVTVEQLPEPKELPDDQLPKEENHE